MGNFGCDKLATESGYAIGAIEPTSTEARAAVSSNGRVGPDVLSQRG